MLILTAGIVTAPAVLAAAAAPIQVNNNNNNNDYDKRVVEGPRVEANVELAKTSCMYITFTFTMLHTNDYAVRRVYPDDIADAIGQPNFNYLIQQFLYDQQHPPEASIASLEPILPMFYERISPYLFAVATFHAPSDLSGVGGMRSERIRAVDSWRNGPARHDCVFLNTDPTAAGMLGLDIARVRLFFSFTSEGIKYQCALVHWFSRLNDSPDENTGMWVVKPDVDNNGNPHASIIHLDTIYRAAHLLGVCGNHFIPTHLSHTQSLDAFRKFYVNKYIDHHAFEIAF